VGLLVATDSEIFNYAATEGYVVITADADFSMLLAARGSNAPSVVLLRHVGELRKHAHAALLTANLPSVIGDLANGAVVSLSPTRLSVRALPITGNSRDC
jgi:predicted nuclease of predicted toxin-antitoxin system